MPVLADNPAIETAPLPALFAVFAIGTLIAVYRAPILRWSTQALGQRTGRFIGWSFVAIGGYGWTLFGACGIVLWLFDRL